MKIFLKVNFAALILIVFASSLFGQSNAQIEQKLVEHIKNIQQWSNYTNSFDENLQQKLDKENETFKRELLKYAERPATLKYDFKNLGEYMNVVTSPDRKLRIFSWDTEEGGTMHSFENVYQFQSKDGKVYSKGSELEEGNAGGFYTDIFQVKAKDGTVYLARFSAILMTSLSYQSIDLFKVENNSLNDKIKLFKTKSGFQNSIGFEYNFFSVVDRPERPIKLILFDEKTRTVKIPVVIKKNENDYGDVTDRFINYKFNGKYFVKIG